jgi:transposase-like protein
MTSMAQESAEIFKQDTKGRVRVHKARREAMLDEYERSGGSAAQFANYVGIKYSTLANWIRRHRHWLPGTRQGHDRLACRVGCR